MNMFQILGLFAALTFLGCQSGSRSNGANTDIIGAWELTGAKLPSGETVSVSTESRIQFEITDSEFAIVTSDDSSITFRSKTKYQLAGNKIVTEDTETTKMPDPEVVSVNSNSMVWRVPTVESPTPDMNMVLTRITTQQLATNSKKTVSSVHAKYTTVEKNKIKVEGQIEAKVVLPSAENETQSIGCYVSQGGELIVGYSNGKNENGKYTFSTEDEHMNMTLKVKFDKSKQEEVIDVSDSKTEEITKFISLKDAVKKVRLSKTDSTQCKYHLNRKKHSLKVDFNCQGLQVSTDKKTDSATLKGEINCRLFSF